MVSRLKMSLHGTLEPRNWIPESKVKLDKCLTDEDAVLLDGPPTLAALSEYRPDGEGIVGITGKRGDRIRICKAEIYIDSPQTHMWRTGVAVNATTGEFGPFRVPAFSFVRL